MDLWGGSIPSYPPLRYTFTPCHCVYTYICTCHIYLLFSSEKDHPVVHVFDSRGESKELAILDNIHSKNIILMEVCVCTCVYSWRYVYVRTCVYSWRYVYVHVCTHGGMCMYVHVCTHGGMCIYMCVLMEVCVYTYMCVLMEVCVYTYMCVLMEVHMCIHVQCVYSWRYVCVCTMWRYVCIHVYM